jgi:hypothetical protein
MKTTLWKTKKYLYILKKTFKFSSALFEVKEIPNKEEINSR